MLSNDVAIVDGMVRTKDSVKDDEADMLDTNKVQFWKNGVMMTAQLPLEEAKKMVREGKAFVITAQAIGAMVDGKRYS